MTAIFFLLIVELNFYFWVLLTWCGAGNAVNGCGIIKNLKHKSLLSSIVISVMAHLDYLWSGSQVILIAILCILTYLYARDTRRSVIFTKADHLSKIYERKCDTIFTFIKGAASCKSQKARDEIDSIIEKESKLNREILDLYLNAVDEYDKEFKLNGKFSHAIRNTFVGTDDERKRLANLLEEEILL